MRCLYVTLLALVWIIFAPSPVKPDLQRIAANDLIAAVQVHGCGPVDAATLAIFSSSSSDARWAMNCDIVNRYH